MRAFIRFALSVSVFSFALHFAWERAHIHLYSGYEHLTSIPIVLYATLGDVGYTLAAIGVLSLVYRNSVWLWAPRPNDFAVLSVLGFLIALFVEYKALWLGRWAYAVAMPTIPLLHVGLSPILQMTVLLPLSVYLASRVSVRSNT